MKKIILKIKKWIFIIAYIAVWVIDLALKLIPAEKVNLRKVLDTVGKKILIAENMIEDFDLNKLKEKNKNV